MRKRRPNQELPRCRMTTSTGWSRSGSRRASRVITRRRIGCARRLRSTESTWTPRRTSGSPRMVAQGPLALSTSQRPTRTRLLAPGHRRCRSKRSSASLCSVSRRAHAATIRRQTCCATRLRSTACISTARRTSGTPPTVARAPSSCPLSQTRRSASSLRSARRRGCAMTTRLLTGCATSSMSSVSRWTTRKTAGTRRTVALGRSNHSPACMPRFPIPPSSSRRPLPVGAARRRRSRRLPSLPWARRVRRHVRNRARRHARPGGSGSRSWQIDRKGRGRARAQRVRASVCSQRRHGGSSPSSCERPPGPRRECARRRCSRTLMTWIARPIGYSIRAWTPRRMSSDDEIERGRRSARFSKGQRVRARA
mmetsp:Transcript_9816/g.20000  ORF Transcript_9816/g.20000 Transcript_9816/m.20000 type:complete len:367 (-) Transcript_9816:401-1501(-)